MKKVTEITPDLARLGIRRFRVHFDGPVAPPARYPGSAWRGAMGRALRRQLCATGAPACSGCPETARCAYPRLFETAAGANADRGRDLARPFWLQAPWPGEDDGRRWLGLTLTGEGNRYVSAYLDALSEAGRRIRGLGPLTVLRFEQEPVPAMAPAPHTVQITLETPLRLRHRGKTVGPDAMTPEILIHALVSRLQSLFRLAGEPTWSGAGAALASARGWTGDTTGLVWEDWSRYSSRQRQRLEMGGLRGPVVASLEGRSALWPLLHAGQWIHCGKGATMGLGRYSLISFP